MKTTNAPALVFRQMSDNALWAETHEVWAHLTELLRELERRRRLEALADRRR